MGVLDSPITPLPSPSNGITEGGCPSRELVISRVRICSVNNVSRVVSGRFQDGEYCLNMLWYEYALNGMKNAFFRGLFRVLCTVYVTVKRKRNRKIFSPPAGRVEGVGGRGG